MEDNEDDKTVEDEAALLSMLVPDHPLTADLIKAAEKDPKQKLSEFYKAWDAERTR